MKLFTNSDNRSESIRRNVVALVVLRLVCPASSISSFNNKIQLQNGVSALKFAFSQSKSNESYSIQYIYWIINKKERFFGERRELSRR